MLKFPGQLHSFRKTTLGDNLITFSIDRAYQLALVEKEIGIQSTYNIQVRNNNYNALSKKNIELARKIYDMGHHIGAHIHTGEFNGDNRDLILYIKKDTKTLSNYLGIQIDRFVFHRPTEEFLEIYFQVVGLMNLYDKPFFHYFEGSRPDNLDVYYFSDSNHQWKYGHPLKEDLSKINKLQLVCHPYSYTKDGWNNYHNFISLITEKNKEIYKSMEEEMLSFPKELLL